MILLCYHTVVFVVSADHNMGFGAALYAAVSGYGYDNSTMAVSVIMHACVITSNAASGEGGSAVWFSLGNTGYSFTSDMAVRLSSCVFEGNTGSTCML